MTRRAALRAGLGGILALAGSCASRRPDAGESRGASPSENSPVPVAEEPWTFGAAAGRVFSTPSYRVFTTIGPGFMLDRLPRFAEHCLARYRTAFLPLAPPRTTLDTYVLANRPQWMRAAAQVLAGTNAPYEQIVRGGITVNGRSVLYDIGPRDTFSLLAHEGWHQYTQNTFREPLPVWLEEGVATVMEGFRWSAEDPDRPEFMPWCNTERFDQLRRGAASGTSTPLSEIVLGSPALAMERGAERTLEYYGQVWALTLFLLQGEQGRYAPGLCRLIRDGAAGEISGAVERHLGQRAAAEYRSGVGGAAVFRAYFGDARAVDGAYTRFCGSATRPGAREAVSVGRSPLGVS